VGFTKRIEAFGAAMLEAQMTGKQQLQFAVSASCFFPVAFVENISECNKSRHLEQFNYIDIT